MFSSSNIHGCFFVCHGLTRLDLTREREIDQHVIIPTFATSYLRDRERKESTHVMEFFPRERAEEVFHGNGKF